MLSRPDAATRGLDQAAGVLVTALLLITTVPAFALWLRRRAPRTALALALAFPGTFAVLFAIAVVGVA